MYVADALYFGFEDYCREHGIAEPEFLKMLWGPDHMPTAHGRGDVEPGGAGRGGGRAEDPDGERA